MTFSLDGSTFNPVTFGAANDGPSAFSKDFHFKEDGCTPDRSPAWPADCRAVAKASLSANRAIRQNQQRKTTARSIRSLRICVRLPKPLVTVRRTPITARSRCASAQGSRCSLVSSDGRCLSDREPLHRMLRSEPFLYITKGEPCDLGFEKCSGETVSLAGCDACQMVR